MRFHYSFGLSSGSETENDANDNHHSRSLMNKQAQWSTSNSQQSHWKKMCHHRSKRDAVELQRAKLLQSPRFTSRWIQSIKDKWCGWTQSVVVRILQKLILEGKRFKFVTTINHQGPEAAESTKPTHPLHSSPGGGVKMTEVDSQKRRTPIGKVTLRKGEESYCAEFCFLLLYFRAGNLGRKRGGMQLQRRLVYPTQRRGAVKSFSKCFL